MTAMPMTSSDRIVLTDTQRGDLDRLVRAGRTEQRLALRAGIVLAAADGQPNVRIAAALGVCEDTVRKWRPVVDFHHGSELRRQGAESSGPVCPGMGWEAIGPQRLCDLRR